MKKKSRIPKFKSYEEEARFWDTHSFTDFMDELKVVHLEFPRPKHLLVTLKPTQLKILKQIAVMKDASYLQLVQKWITDKLREEKLAASH